MSNNNTSLKIDKYFNSLPSWSKEICIKLREIIHAGDPNVEEAWKWGQPAFLHNGKMLCFVWPFTKHINFTFHRGALMKDPAKIFSNVKNLKSRTVYIKDISQINEKVLVDYVKEAVQLIERGKDIKIPVSKDKTVVIPSRIKKILEDRGLLEEC